MQPRNSKKAKIIYQALAEAIQDLRLKQGKSQRILSSEYDYPKSLLSRVENGVNEAKIISIWTISESLGIKISDLLKIVEEKLPEDFKLMDE